MSWAKIKDKILSGETTVTQLTEEYIERIEKHNSQYNCFITTVDKDVLLKQAAEADKRYSDGNPRYLEGLLIGVKDNFCTKGIRTTAGSKMLEDFIPPYESTVTRRLLEAGAIILGKTNMDEFGMGSSTTHSHFGPTPNAVDSSRVAGGSSGGSATCVASDLGMAAIGTDTGGSIRQPAAFNGIVGLKPTYGRCSRYGMISYASSLDQAGPMTKTVRDAAMMLFAMAGIDQHDSTCSFVGVPYYASACERVSYPLRIGVAIELFESMNIQDGCLERFRSLLSVFDHEHHYPVKYVSIPSLKFALPAYYVIATSEASSNLSRYDGIRFGHRTSAECESLEEFYEKTRAEGFGDEVKRRILVGTYCLSAGHYDDYYGKALKVREVIKNDFNEAFKEVDVILSLTTPGPAFPLQEQRSEVETYLEDMFTVPANLAGLPALSVPIGKDEQGLPLGIQIIGKKFDEETVLSVGAMIERIVDNWEESKKEQTDTE